MAFRFGVVFAGWLAHASWHWTRDPSSHIMWPTGGRTSWWDWRGRGGDLQSKNHLHSFLCLNSCRTITNTCAPQNFALLFSNINRPNVTQKSPTYLQCRKSTSRFSCNLCCMKPHILFRVFLNKIMQNCILHALQRLGRGRRGYGCWRGLLENMRSNPAGRLSGLWEFAKTRFQCDDPFLFSIDIKKI